jgi:1-acyl-sn-glycerol-3-phosphate acyltransferase
VMRATQEKSLPDLPGRRDWVWGCSLLLCKVAFSPFFRLRIHGVENLPRGESFILLPKHQRWEDIPLLGIATPRPLYYVAKHELFTNPIGGWVLRSLGGIPLNRKRPLESRRSLKRIIRLLEQGEGLVVFPEGTYFRDRMGPGQRGIVKLILTRLSLPFVPVGIQYSKEAGRALVRIHYGRPVHFEPRDSVEGFLFHLMQKIAVLSGLAPEGESATT